MESLGVYIYIYMILVVHELDLEPNKRHLI